jgi:hypothetical protein
MLDKAIPHQRVPLPSKEKRKQQLQNVVYNVIRTKNSVQSKFSYNDTEPLPENLR